MFTNYKGFVFLIGLLAFVNVYAEKEILNESNFTLNYLILELKSDVDLLGYAKSNIYDPVLIDKIEYKIIDKIILISGLGPNFDEISIQAVYSFDYLIQYNKNYGLDKNNKNPSRDLAVEYLVGLEQKIKYRLEKFRLIMKGQNEWKQK